VSNPTTERYTARSGSGHDKRIIAATKVVGGGESTTVKFSTAALLQGARYVFFRTSPGHSSVMRGKIRVWRHRPRGADGEMT
jgi:azurin